MPSDGWYGMGVSSICYIVVWGRGVLVTTKTNDAHPLPIGDEMVDRGVKTIYNIGVFDGEGVVTRVGHSYSQLVCFYKKHKKVTQKQMGVLPQTKLYKL